MEEGASEFNLDVDLSNTADFSDDLEGQLVNKFDKKTKKKKSATISKKDRLSGWDYKKSKSWDVIKSRFGKCLDQTNIYCMLQICADKAGLKIDREAKREKQILIKWFEENFDHVIQFFNNISPCDEFLQPIGPNDV